MSFYFSNLILQFAEQRNKTIINPCLVYRQKGEPYVFFNEKNPRQILFRNKSHSTAQKRNNITAFSEVLVFLRFQTRLALTTSEIALFF